MAKIGFDARMYGKGQSGIGTYIKQLTDQLFILDKNNDYYLFLLEPIFSQYQPIVPNVHKIKVTSRWYSYSEQTKFLAEINRYKLDLMHFPHFNAPVFYNRLRIHTIHDITPKFFPGHKQKSWWRKKAYDLTIKTSLQKSAKIITISEYTKNDLIKHFAIKPDKISVTYLGLEDNFKISDNYAKIKALKSQLQITKPYLFFISAWRNHKNFLGLIKAFESLRNQTKLDYQLVLGGQADPYYPDIEQSIKKSPYAKDIITPGFIEQEDLPYFYQAAELVVIPSFYEGFGFIGLEAMACGTPVASSNLASLPEIMADAALYFDPHDQEAMTKTIIQGLTDQNLQDQLRRKGFDLIKKYSWSDCAQKTLDIYQQILST